MFFKEKNIWGWVDGDQQNLNSENNKKKKVRGMVA